MIVGGSKDPHKVCQRVWAVIHMCLKMMNEEPPPPAWLLPVKTGAPCWVLACASPWGMPTFLLGESPEWAQVQVTVEAGAWISKHSAHTHAPAHQALLGLWTCSPTECQPQANAHSQRPSPASCPWLDRCGSNSRLQPLGTQAIPRPCLAKACLPAWHLKVGLWGQLKPSRALCSVHSELHHPGLSCPTTR